MLKNQLYGMVNINRLFLTLALFSSFATADDAAVYLRIDLSAVIDEQDYFIGYYKDYKPSKINEIPTDKDQSIIRATIELGWETSTGWSVGLRHLSSPSGGCPMNCGEIEYFKNEIFVGYKFGGLR